MKNFNNSKSAWCLTDGSAGMISQVKGLAEALKLNYKLIKVKLKFPWSVLKPGLLPLSSYMFIENEDLSIKDKPDFIISCGKRSIYASLFYKKYFGDTYNIHIQNPKISSSYFDLIVCPKHDNLNGENILTTRLALNHISKEILEEENENFKNEFDNINQPICTVMVGGKSRNFRINEQDAIQFADILETVFIENNIYPIILFSRRTDNDIKKVFSNKFGNSDTIWKKNNNPYLALLSRSSFIICTNDSVSMVSEAICAKKSVYLYSLPSLKANNRIEKFNETIISEKLARKLDLKLELHENSHVNETEQVASLIYERYNKQHVS